ncbi:MAG: flagellin, partial [Rhodospirillales bacterium]
MTRISSLASNTALVNQLLRTQARLFDLQTQVSSEKVSQDYTGIALDSQRLINIENSRDSLKRFVDNNNQMETRLKITDTALAGIREIIDNFRKNLDIFQGGSTKDQTRVQTIQDDAFRSLKSLEDLLNTEVNGRFLFAGARVSTEPANFGLSTIAAFQATFDGARVTIPTTRDATLEDFSFNKNSTTGAANWLTFERFVAAAGGSRVTATSAEFSNVTVGSTITISGTGGINDGTYTVKAVGGGGTTIDIKTEQLTDEAAVPVTITYQDPANINGTLSVSATVTFTRANNTITAAVAGALTDIPVGAKITIAGAAAGPPTNNGSFTV